MHGLHVPEALSPGSRLTQARLRCTFPEALSPGSRLTQRQGKAAMQEYAKGAGKGLKARGGFKGGAKCLTSLLEAHKKRRGRPASCREEEEGKAAVQE